MRAISMVLAGALLATAGACSSLVGPGDDLSRRVDYLRQDIQDLTAQQKQLVKEVEALRAQAGPAPAQAAAPAPAAAVPSEEASRRVEIQNLAADPASLYKTAFDLMEARKYTEAERNFADFIRRFPQSDLADNAQYWIGECLYSEKNYQEAEKAFEAVSEHFPFGNKVPDAMYKQAVCQIQLGQKLQAEATIRKLTENFPDSDAAAKAKSLHPAP
jgi:tol-pal system protein YbgF